MGKIGKLLQDLLKASDQGKISWEATAAESSFRTKLANGMVRIECPHPTLWPETPPGSYRLTLLDTRGRIVDSVTISPAGAEGLEAENFEMARQLFERVRRSAGDVSQFLDRLISEIESKSS